jgi:hypothetical protein
MSFIVTQPRNGSKAKKSKPDSPAAAEHWFYVHGIVTVMKKEVCALYI